VLAAAADPEIERALKVAERNLATELEVEKTLKGRQKLLASCLRREVSDLS
jgi:hypothetical protein